MLQTFDTVPREWAADAVGFGLRCMASYSSSVMPDSSSSSYPLRPRRPRPLPRPLSRPPCSHANLQMHDFTSVEVHCSGCMNSITFLWPYCQPAPTFILTLQCLAAFQRRSHAPSLQRSLFRALMPPTHCNKFQLPQPCITCHWLPMLNLHLL